MGREEIKVGHAMIRLRPRLIFRESGRSSAFSLEAGQPGNCTEPGTITYWPKKKAGQSPQEELPSVASSRMPILLPDQNHLLHVYLTFENKADEVNPTRDIFRRPGQPVEASIILTLQ